MEEKIFYRSIPKVTIHFKDEQALLRAKVYSSKDIYNFVLPFFDDCMQHHEEMNVMYINNANKVIGIQCISKGTDTSTCVSIKSILQGAILSNASCIALIHNHPSGSLRPSMPDNKCTEKAKKAAELFDITLLDHLIVSEEGYYSYSDEGYL